MCDDRARQRAEVITAFEHRNDPAVGVIVGDPSDQFRDPEVVVLDEPDVAQRIGFMGIEPRGDQDEVGLMARQGR